MAWSSRVTFPQPRMRNWTTCSAEFLFGTYIFVDTCGVLGSVTFLCTRKRQVIHACGREVRLCRTSSQAAYPEEYSGWRGRGFQACSLEWSWWDWQPRLSKHGFQEFSGRSNVQSKLCLLEMFSGSLQSALWELERCGLSNKPCRCVPSITRTMARDSHMTAGALLGMRNPTATRALVATKSPILEIQEWGTLSSSRLAPRDT